ncbi:MBL fold metallo-hydrolase [Dictyobacter alpinus]|uniref:MBL fold metallo-hydrolase n=1 Tax=Dictyobacter alpinus TaxID=2014873 RepID=A0A402BCW0_9CHLR|nr:MBL fold metallo-hydrolase [Dictyobacter alpinus]GCE29117.1 MBL fold metallo-hydrolase [Dictyobacter alpinus]
MKINNASQHLFQLTCYAVMNCYLVSEDDGFTLIDTTISGQGKSIIQMAQKLGKPITRIVLTHAHVDHVGSLDELHAALPDAEVMISERDARFLTGDKSLDPTEPQVPLKGGYPVCTTKPTRLLHEGDRIGSLEVIATPGHTPGHLAFLDQRDRALIVGDAFQTQGGTAVSGKFQLLFPLPALATWHKPSCQNSARKLLALQPSLLAVGHGRVLQQPQAEMQRAIETMERLLAKEKAKGK